MENGQSRPAASRANYRARGAYYEQVAAAWLSERGYCILERNYRCRMGEIDLIANDGDYIVFVEVKYRTTKASGYPAMAVDAKKQQRIINAARWYLMEHHKALETPVRFDVVGICGSNVKLYQDAFCA